MSGGEEKRQQLGQVVCNGLLPGRVVVVRIGVGGSGRFGLHDAEHCRLPVRHFLDQIAVQRPTCLRQVLLNLITT